MSTSPLSEGRSHPTHALPGQNPHHASFLSSALSSMWVPGAWGEGGSPRRSCHTETRTRWVFVMEKRAVGDGPVTNGVSMSVWRPSGPHQVRVRVLSSRS